MHGLGAEEGELGCTVQYAMVVVYQYYSNSICSLYLYVVTIIMIYNLHSNTNHIIHNHTTTTATTTIGNHDNRQALLAELDSDEGDQNPDRDYDDTFSSQDGGSGHYFHKIPHSRMSTSSAESYDTISSGHTVYRNTATTNEFSTSYRPRNTRKSESCNYFTGSVIVNALMWPIGSSNNPYRSSSTLSQASSAGNLADPSLVRVGEIASTATSSP